MNAQDIAYCLKKRKRLLEDLNSDKHYMETPTIAYGHHDPTKIPVAECQQCGNKPQMLHVTHSPSRWRMLCACCGNAHHSPAKSTWLAALNWNGINLSTQDYRDLPLFGLSNMTPTEAHERLVGIRKNVELRVALARVEQRLCRSICRIDQPGKGYRLRMDAYLQWCMLGLRLTKLAIATQAANERQVS